MWCTHLRRGGIGNPLDAADATPHTTAKSDIRKQVDLFLSGTKAQTVHTPNFLPGARAHRPVPLQAQAQNPQIFGRIGAVKSVKVNQLKEAIKHGRQQQQQKQQKQQQNRDFLQKLDLTSNRALPSENNPAEAESSSECAQWFQQRKKEGAAAGSAFIWRDGVKIPVKPAGRVLGGLGTFRRVQTQQRTPAVPQHQPPPGSCEAQRSRGENMADVGAAQDTLASRALLLRAQQPRALQAPVTEAPKRRPLRSARAPGRVADESSWGPWGILDSAESGSSPAHRAATERVHSCAEIPESLGVGGEATAAPSLSGADHGHAPLAPIIVAVAPQEACGDESARHARLGRSARGPAVGDEGSGDGAGGAGEDETGGDDARTRRSYNPDEERLRAARRLFARKACSSSPSLATRNRTGPFG
jgi:hypothetical protein